MKYKNTFITLLLLVLTILLSLHNYYTILLINIDEGIALYGAKRIILGQILYKDFFDIVTPGTDYLLAGVFKIFGTTLKAARITTIVANALNVAMLYSISNSFTKNKKLALIPSVLLMMIYITDVDYYAVSHHWFAITTVIFTLLLSIKSEEGKLSWVFPGIGTFLVFIFMQSDGFIVYGMLVIFLLVKIFLNKDKQRYILHDFIYYSLGFWIPIVVLCLLFYANGGLKDFMYDVFIWPINHYKTTNDISYFTVPFNNQLLQIYGYSFIEKITLPIIWYFPLLLLFLSITFVIIEYSKNRTIDYHLILLLLILSSLFISELFNPEILRIVVYGPLILIMILTLWGRDKTLFHSFFKAISIFYLIGGLTFTWYTCRTEFKNANFVGKHSLTVKSAAGDILVANNSPGMISNILTLLNALNWEFPENTFIFYWSPIIYFMSGTNNPTILNTYVPLYNTRAQVDKVIQQLESSKPPLIIMDNYLDLLRYQWTWRNVNPGVFDPSNDKILQYVNQHYVVDKELYGVYTIYKLKD